MGSRSRPAQHLFRVPLKTDLGVAFGSAERAPETCKVGRKATRGTSTVRTTFTPGNELSIDELTALASEPESTDQLLYALSWSWPSLVAENGPAVRAVFDTLDPALWQSDAWLVAAYGATYHSVGSSSRSAALPYFSAASSLITDSTPHPARIGIALHHAAALRSLGHLEEALDRAEYASELVDADTSIALMWRIRLGTKIALQRGITRYHLGDFDGAKADLGPTAGLASANLYRHEQVACFAALAMVEYSLGEFERAVRNAQLAREIADASGLLESLFGAPALIAELLVAVEQNRRDDADRAAHAVAALSERSDWAPLSLYARAAVSIISEHYVEGLDLLRRCVQAYRQWTPPGMIVTISEGLRATLLLRLGDTATAWDILGSLGPTQNHANCPARFIAHLRFITGDVPGTLSALRDCEALGDAHSARTLVDVLLLKAAASYELDRAGVADVAFDRALLLAAHNDMRIPFRLVPGDVMRSMLDRAASRPHSPAVGVLFDDISASDISSGGAPRVRLSERERDVIRAVVRNLTVNEIAEELFISVNTVKSHLKSVYRKLGVTSRAGAIKRARELGHQIDIAP